MTGPIAPVTLGVDLSAITTRLDRMEELMASEAEQLTALTGRLDDLVADVRALVEAVRTDKANFSDEGQAAFDTLDAKLAAFDTEIGDADGSDTPPAPEPPAEPPVI